MVILSLRLLFPLHYTKHLLKRGRAGAEWFDYCIWRN